MFWPKYNNHNINTKQNELGDYTVVAKATSSLKAFT